MARVLLVSTATTPRDFWYDEYARITRCAGQDVFQRHTITADPEAADLIIFFEPEDAQLATDVTGHPYARRYPDKTFLFDPSDRIVPFLPGIYASIERWQYNATRMRSGFFPVVFDHDWITYDPQRSPPELLFSFVGDIRGNATREAIARLVHPRAMIRDTGRDPANHHDAPDAAQARFHQEFADILANSAFGLCPRGAGVSTFRLFETMKAGRVPVIISDSWVPPEGPAWETFSLRVRERDTPKLPALLERHEGAAAGMAAIARQQWELWFSASASFHRIVEWCLSIQQSRRIPERVARTLVMWQLLEPFNLRYKLLPGLRTILRLR